MCNRLADVREGSHDERREARGMDGERLAIGLMCGTSLDGIDAALVAIGDAEPRYRVERFATFPLAPDVRARTLAAQSADGTTALAISELHRDLGEAFGEAAAAIAGDAALAFVASHGVTIAHAGVHTLQIGDAFRIRERLGGVQVVYDFRAADCAAGGTGAPLVPFVDAMLFATTSEDRVALNLGGIANLTVLPAGANADALTAFDSGPANMAIDGYVARRTLGVLAYDRDGALAAAGTVARPLLDAMLDNPYFAAPPPKSTGRERFGDAFLARYGPLLDLLPLEDAVATLTSLTAETVAAAIVAHAPRGARVVVSGGGQHNATLMRELAARVPASAVVGSETLGVDPDAKEALAFAVLGDAVLRGVRAGLPSVTGARFPALLGAIAPDARR